MDKDQLNDLIRAKLITSILKDIVREAEGEETVQKLEELSMLQRRIREGLEKPKMISHEDVDRFNILVSKLFPERGERDAEADMDQ